VTAISLCYRRGLTRADGQEPDRYGATLGKMACGLRVINQHGRRLSITSNDKKQLAQFPKFDCVKILKLQNHAQPHTILIVGRRTVQ
jgi:RDD family